MAHAKRHDQPKARVKIDLLCVVVVYLVASEEERGAGGAQQSKEVQSLNPVVVCACTKTDDPRKGLARALL